MIQNDGGSATEQPHVTDLSELFDDSKETVSADTDGKTLPRKS